MPSEKLKQIVQSIDYTGGNLYAEIGGKRFSICPAHRLSRKIRIGMKDDKGPLVITLTAERSKSLDIIKILDVLANSGAMADKIRAIYNLPFASNYAEFISRNIADAVLNGKLEGLLDRIKALTEKDRKKQEADNYLEQNLKRLLCNWRFLCAKIKDRLVIVLAKYEAPVRYPVPNPVIVRIAQRYGLIPQNPHGRSCKCRDVVYYVAIIDSDDAKIRTTRSTLAIARMLMGEKICYKSLKKLDRSDLQILNGDNIFIVLMGLAVRIDPAYLDSIISFIARTKITGSGD